MELGDNKQINNLRLEIASKTYGNDIMKMQLMIYIIDRISINVGGLANLPNDDEHIRLLAIELVDADYLELIEMFNKIVML